MQMMAECIMLLKEENVMIKQHLAEEASQKQQLLNALL